MSKFQNDIHFDERAQGNKSVRDRFLIKLDKSPAIMASGISTTFLSSDHNELCDRLKILIQEKQAGNNSHTINDEMVAKVDNF